MDILFSILPIIVLVIFLWLFYVNLSLLYTVLKLKKSDKSLTLCINTMGLIFYTILGIIYIGICTVGVYFAIINFQTDMTTTLTILNIGTTATLIISYFFGQITFIGNRQMLIGKILLDYRKVKRVSYPKDTKLRFTYGQKSYETPMRFLDVTRVKHALQKCR